MITSTPHMCQRGREGDGPGSPGIHSWNQRPRWVAIGCCTPYPTQLLHSLRRWQEGAKEEQQTSA